MLTEEELQDLLKAGEIARAVVEFAKANLKPGADLLEACKAMDAKIAQLGGLPAWPTQLAINDVAAHWTAEQGDGALGSCLVSVDIGVCCNGWIADTAFTLDFSGAGKELIKATESALSAAIAAAEPGAAIADIGAVIEAEITAGGFNPIKNLSGHGLGKWSSHTKPSLPNFKTGTGRLEPGQIIAIEPFATTGIGFVEERGRPRIFAVAQKKPVRALAKKVLDWVWQQRQGLPFARRWAIEEFGGQAELALAELQRLDVLKQYRPLVERTGGLVAVSEKTIYITENSAKVIT